MTNVAYFCTNIKTKQNKTKKKLKQPRKPKGMDKGTKEQVDLKGKCKTYMPPFFLKQK